MLPSVICFIDGVAVDRVVGFSELGNTDEFKTIELTRRLVKSGVIKPRNGDEMGFQMNKLTKKNSDSDDDD